MTFSGPSSEIALGAVIGGKLRVERILGRGGMGVVVAAHHLQLDTRVAIKFLHPEMLADPDAVTRFAREGYDELRKVVGPTAVELWRYTMCVVVTVFVLAAFIGAVDSGVGEFVKRFVYSGLAKT